MSGQEQVILREFREAMSPYLSAELVAALDAVLNEHEDAQATPRLEHEVQDMHDAIKEAFVLLSRPEGAGDLGASLAEKAALDVLRPFAQPTQSPKRPGEAHQRSFG
ncbi:MAG: hypothetical protein ABWY83_05440 [Actinomycetota bacterium]